jgi:hypothetical protein
MNTAAKWATISLAVGWAFFEVGFGLSRARFVVQLLVRVPLYAIVLPMLKLLAGIAVLNNLLPH